MRASSAFIGLLLACLLGAAPAACAVPAACTAAEETLFACSTGRKQVAVCGSPGWSAEHGQLQYRYGTAQRAELVLPDPAAPPMATAQAGRMALSGGGGAWLRFHHGTTEYVVYSAIGASLGEKAGVVVERAGRRLSALPCKGKVVTGLGDALMRKGGFAADGQPFDLPD